MTRLHRGFLKENIVSGGSNGGRPRCAPLIFLSTEPPPTIFFTPNHGGGGGGGGAGFRDKLILAPIVFNIPGSAPDGGAMLMC